MKVHTRLRCESRKERHGFEDSGIDIWEENIKMDLKDDRIQTGFTGCLYKAMVVGGQGCRKYGIDEGAHKILLRMPAKTIPV